MSIAGPLVDRFGRVHTDLRVSVTDRCNLRCHYCMPCEQRAFRSHAEVLAFEEIERFVRTAARLGIREVRLTGGEPLVRRDVCRLVEMLAAVPGVEDLAITTNGILLPRDAESLKAAGLHRLNVSLDTLNRQKFHQISQSDLLPTVLEGIAHAHDVGFRQIKLNAVAVRGQTEEEVVGLARFARQYEMELRFIEFMPLDGDARWEPEQVLKGQEILELLTEAIGPLAPVPREGSNAPATQYRFLDGGPAIGIVPTVSEPFCDSCGRLRLTADGRIRNCLFASREFDARTLLRNGGSQPQLVELIREAVEAKEQQHGTSDGRLARTERTMHQLGG